MGTPGPTHHAMLHEHSKPIKVYSPRLDLLDDKRYTMVKENKQHEWWCVRVSCMVRHDHGLSHALLKMLLYVQICFDGGEEGDDDDAKDSPSLGWYIHKSQFRSDQIHRLHVWLTQ
jgi:hypothetical protein